MSSRTSELVLKLTDRMTGPAKGAANALGGLTTAAKNAGLGASTEMQRLTNELKKAQGAANSFNGFQKLRSELPKLRSELPKLRSDFNAAQDRVKALGREMAATETPTARMKAAMERARNEVKRTHAAFTAKAQAITQARSALQQMGVATDRLSSSQRTVKGAIDAATASIKRQAEIERQAARAAEVAAQKREAFARRLSAVGGMATGAYVAGQMITRPVGKAMTYDERLTYAAGTAAGGGTIDAKRAAKEQIGAGVDNAVIVGGGKRDDALTAYEKLTASGQFTADEVRQVLPLAQATGVAMNTAPEDIADMLTAFKRAGVKMEEMAEAADMAARSGQLGGFELKDQARWLPQQLALERQLGRTGKEAVRNVVASNQVVLSTAGSTDEAANNYVNLQAKLSSREMHTSLGKAIKPRKGDPKSGGKFDWNKYKLEAAKRGVSADDAFMELLDRELASNKEYVAARAALDNAKSTEERKAASERLLPVIEGSQIGEVIADRQATMALIALRRGKAEKERIAGELQNAKGTVDAESKFVREQTFSKTQDLRNTTDKANADTYDAISGPLGSFVSGLNDAARAFPELTAAIYGGAQVVGAVGAGGLVGSSVALLGSAKALDVSAAALMAAAKAQGGAGVAGDLAKKGGGAAGWFARSLPWLAVGGTAVAATSLANYTTPDEDKRLAEGSASSRSVRAQHGDKILQAARDKYQPWWARTFSLDAEDSSDAEYVRKYLEDRKRALGTVPAGDATLGGVGKFASPQELANLSTNRGFIQDPKAFVAGTGPVTTIAAAPASAPVKLDGAMLQAEPIRNAAEAAAQAAAASFEATMNGAFERVQAKAVAAASSAQAAWSFTATPQVNWPAAPSWGAGGGQRAIQSDVGLGTP